MAFPVTPLPVVAQWFVDGAWADLVRADDPTIPGANGDSALFGMERGGVRVGWGRPDETRDPDPATCEFMLWNGDGRFTPWNPHGPFYGLFGLNTPVRVGVTADAAWLRFHGPGQGSEGETSASGARVTAPDSVPLSITGDIDIRLCADLDTWVPRESSGVDLVGKWTGTAGQRSFQLVLQVGTSAGGWLSWFWSTDGTATSSAFCTVPLPVTEGLLSVRVTHDVNNGAAGNDVVFYTSTDTDLSSASWTQLGDTVTGSGTTSIFNSTTVVTIGDTATGSQARTIRGKWFSAQIRNGIAGTIVANPDFTAQTAGASSFADTASSPNTWTLTGDVAIEDTDWRFWGEIPELTPRRDTSGNDNTVPVRAVGVMQRLGAGNNPVQSPMRKSLGARTDAVAYWPMEDGSDAEAFGSALQGGRILKWAEAVPNLAADTQFAASLPLPTMNGSRVTGVIPYYSHTGVINLQWLGYIPAATTDDRMIVRLSTASSRWDVVYGDVSGGSLQLQWYDADGVQISETAFITFAVDNDLRWFSLELTQDGADVDYRLATLQVGASSGTTTTGTAAGVTMGRATAFRTGHTGHDPDEVFGHVIVTSSIYSIYDVYEQLNAFIGETAGRRLERLAQENGVQFTWRGDLDQTVEMGAQGVATTLALMREAANTDHGILYEPPDAEGLQYRTRESLSRQQPQVTLSVETGHDPSALEPAATTAYVSNQVTVKRGGTGSSVSGAEVTAAITDGPLGTDTIGTVNPTSYTVNVNSDTDLPHHAEWLLHLGTVNEPRIDTLTVQLARTSSFATDAARGEARAAGVGDLVVVTDLPEELGPPDDMRQLVQGGSEVLGNFQHDITWNLAPASPYDVAVFDDTDDEPARYTSDGTVTAEALDTTETSIDVSTASGPKWTTDAAEYPFDIRIGGERITVAGCTGTGTAQTFTGCTRSVNGVVASHDSGVDVELWRPFYWDF